MRYKLSGVRHHTCRGLSLLVSGESAHIHRDPFILARSAPQNRRTAVASLLSALMLVIIGQLRLMAAFARQRIYAGEHFDVLELLAGTAPDRQRDCRLSMEAKTNQQYRPKIGWKKSGVFFKVPFGSS